MELIRSNLDSFLLFGCTLLIQILPVHCAVSVFNHNLNAAAHKVIIKNYNYLHVLSIIKLVLSAVLILYIELACNCDLGPHRECHTNTR